MRLCHCGGALPPDVRNDVPGVTLQALLPELRRPGNKPIAPLCCRGYQISNRCCMACFRVAGR